MMTVVLNKELRLIIKLLKLYNLKEIGFVYAYDKNMNIIMYIEKLNSLIMDTRK